MIDLSDIDELKKHLKRYGLWAEKSLGQHFLVDHQVLQDIIDAGDLRPEDRVLEVGAGPGVLSQRLAPRVRSLISLEIDRVMIVPWRDVMKDYPNARILAQDVLQYTPDDEPYKLIANIPYYITSPILKHFLRQQRVRRPDIMVILMQKDVAERIVDKKQPTMLSWEIGVFGEATLASSVPAKAFFPPPKVESAILKIQLFAKPLLADEMIEPMFKLMAKSYQQPRKTLANNLTSGGVWKKDEVAAQLATAGIPANLRPHQLSLMQWTSLLRQTLNTKPPQTT